MLGSYRLRIEISSALMSAPPLLPGRAVSISPVFTSPRPRLSLQTQRSTPLDEPSGVDGRHTGDGGEQHAVDWTTGMGYGRCQVAAADPADGRNAMVAARPRVAVRAW